MSDQQRHSDSYELHATQPDVQCLVCTRPFILDTEIADSFEALAICSECKVTVLSDNYRDLTTRTNQQTRRSRQRSRVTRDEPMGDTFAQQFSQLINLARQGHEADVDSPTVPRQHASYSSTPNRSQRWHSSDDESDGLNYADSVFGEIESNISFGDDGGESDASLEHQTTMGREIFIQLDSESYMNTDTDIDPMNAGLDQWDSDDPEDDEGEQSEESDLGEAGDTMQERWQRWHDIDVDLIGLNEQEPEDTVWTWRTAGSQGVNMTNFRADTEGQFGMLLEQFAEDNNTTRGAPPAATSSVQNLPSVVISTSNEINGDDTEYERSKRVATTEGSIHGVERTHSQETIEETSYEPEVEGSSNTVGGTMEQTNTHEHAVYSAQQPNRARGRHRWLYIAAAPVVSLVSLALVLCFTNSAGNVRRQLCRRS
ncbi:uncharacterized protein C2845_PM17G00180 [Panicum miliaceum]|uniref:Uncharacterized protein n=1 Tax=Panicum miliaceum TaxID=4540 RepID=A0A3L6Q2C0_PANMI|nr:uncharacterized protein C2845_PM17G00180 [Panicum miliaceum]